MRVVWSRRGFRMILYAENGLTTVLKSLHGLIVQIDMRDGHFRISQRIGIYAESMILRSDLYSSRLPVQHRMVCAMMPEFQFVRFSAQRQPEQLMAQADTKYRNLANQLSYFVCLTRKRFGISRSIRKEDAVRLQRKRIFRRCAGWNHGQTRADLDQMPQYVALNSIVVGDYVKLRLDRRG